MVGTPKAGSYENAHEAKKTSVCEFSTALLIKEYFHQSNGKSKFSLWTNFLAELLGGSNRKFNLYWREWSENK